MALEDGAAAPAEEQVASRAPGQAHFTGLQELVALKQYGNMNLGSYCSFFGIFSFLFSPLMQVLCSVPPTRLVAALSRILSLFSMDKRGLKERRNLNPMWKISLEGNCPK